MTSWARLSARMPAAKAPGCEEIPPVSSRAGDSVV
jgi:hypothetical protein